MAVTQAEFKQALARFATGVTIITVDYENEVRGMTANAFASVSLNPLLVLVCVDHKARTHAYLHARQRFGINILAENQRAISEHYALTTQIPSETEKTGARFGRTTHGTPILEGAVAYLECRLHTTQDVGDHTIFIGAVEDLVVREGRPLLYFLGQYWKLGQSNE